MISLDATFQKELMEVQTVTKNGNSVDAGIEGVVRRSALVHNDHRGRVFEIFAGDTDEFWQEPLVHSYLFSVRVNQTKGWGLHTEKVDRYTLITGETLTVLYDARTKSTTHGLIERVYLSEQGFRQLRIPAGVWHMNINISDTESILVNHPTTVYNHAQPDRALLPWNSPSIPIDLTQFFPIQVR